VENYSDEGKYWAPRLTYTWYEGAMVINIFDAWSCRKKKECMFQVPNKNLCSLFIFHSALTLLLMSFGGKNKNLWNVIRYVSLSLQVKNGRRSIPSLDYWVCVYTFSYKSRSDTP
jgi:hypothetical protein